MGEIICQVARAPKAPDCSCHGAQRTELRSSPRAPAVGQGPPSCGPASLPLSTCGVPVPTSQAGARGPDHRPVRKRGRKTRREGKHLPPLQPLLSAQCQDGRQDTGASLPTVGLPPGGRLRSPRARMPQPHPCSLCSLTSERHSLALRRPPAAGFYLYNV